MYKPMYKPVTSEQEARRIEDSLLPTFKKDLKLKDVCRMRFSLTNWMYIREDCHYVEYNFVWYETDCGKIYSMKSYEKYKNDIYITYMVDQAQRELDMAYYDSYRSYIFNKRHILDDEDYDISFQEYQANLWNELQKTKEREYNRLIS